MTSLLSVLLVSSSSSGSKLLFAYPPNAVATPRVQRPLYGKSSAVRDVQARSPTLRAPKRRGEPGAEQTTSDDDEEDEEQDSGEDMFGSRFIRGESSSSSSSSSEDEDDYYESATTNGAPGENIIDYVHDEYLTREQRQTETYKVHLGLDTSVLGTLLCPVKELCNKRFEMVVNHLAFIAHPVSKRSRSSVISRGGAKSALPQSSRSTMRRTSHATAREGGGTAASTMSLSRTSTFEPTFGSDEEDDLEDQEGSGNDEGERDEAPDGTSSSVAQSLLETKRGRKPRDLRTNSTGQESLHQHQQSRMGYRPPSNTHHQQSVTGSGPNSRRTSHSLPNRPPPLGLGQQAHTASTGAAIANTNQEKVGGTRRSGSSSASSAPPPRFRQMHSSQLQMSTSSSSAGAVAGIAGSGSGGGAEDGVPASDATTSASASLPPVLGPASSSATTNATALIQSVPPQLPPATPSSTTSSTFDSANSTAAAAAAAAAAAPDSAVFPEPAASATASGKAEQEESDLNVFSIVLVIDSPPDQHLTYHLGVYYRDVIAPVMAALKSIEKSARYMSRETELIAGMREKAVEAGEFESPSSPVEFDFPSPGLVYFL